MIINIRKRAVKHFDGGHSGTHSHRLYEKICKKCNKTFNGRNNAIYCSLKCSSNRKFDKERNDKIRGCKNGAWKGGISFTPYTLDWTESLRISIRERDKYVCRMCGEKQGDKVLSVHHIDYNKDNCNPNNLVSLCVKCHAKTNHNREQWTSYFNNLIK
jgi:5-methylcytosine-specific restriction endonuclease McrA